MVLRKLTASLPVYVRGSTETQGFRAQDTWNRDVKQILETGRHDVQRLPLHGTAFQRLAPATANGPTLTEAGWGSGNAFADTLQASIPIDEGERMVGVKVHINRDPSHSIVAKVIRVTRGIATRQLGVTKTSALTFGDDTLEIDFTETAEGSTITYIVQVTIDATAVANDLRLYSAHVLHDRI